MTQVVRDPARWQGLVVITANTAWEQNPLAAKNLALQLQRYTPVLYVDPPVSYVTARRQPELRASLDGPRLRLVTPRIARLTPVVLPGKDRPGMSAVTDRITHRAIRRAVRVLGGNARAIIEIAPNHHFAAAVPGATRVFWVQDDYTADPALTGIAPNLLIAGEDRHSHDADVVVAVSPHLVERWQPRHPQVALIANGCDLDDFGAALTGTAPPEVATRAPYAVVVSRFSPRIDLTLLERVAESDLPLVLVGAHEAGFEDARWNALVQRPSVCWVGAQPFEQVPAYLAGAAVGLVPYTASQFNRASFPLKTLEYLAAGIPVVSTDLPFLDWLDCEFVARTSDANAFTTAVRAAVTLPRDAKTAVARHEFARNHSWAARAREWAPRLGIPVSDA
ncbi:MAG: glycosyltransferase [Acidimicrobiia bacterium]